MKTVLKALAGVIRKQNDKLEILAFQHPFAGVQLPKGTVESGETIEAATLRELHEESGIQMPMSPRVIGKWERIVGGGPNEDGPLEINLWSISIFWTDEKFPDNWQHEAIGSVAEKGLLFDFFWLPVDSTLTEKLEPTFRPSAKMIVEFCCQETSTRRQIHPDRPDHQGSRS